jgi:hypothetical protein
MPGELVITVEACMSQFSVAIISSPPQHTPASRHTQWAFSLSSIRALRRPHPTTYTSFPLFLSHLIPAAMGIKRPAQCDCAAATAALLLLLHLQGCVAQGLTRGSFPDGFVFGTASAAYQVILAAGFLISSSVPRAFLARFRQTRPRRHRFFSSGYQTAC